MVASVVGEEKLPLALESSRINSLLDATIGVGSHLNCAEKLLKPLEAHASEKPKTGFYKSCACILEAPRRSESRQRRIDFLGKVLFIRSCFNLGNHKVTTFYNRKPKL